MIPEPLEIAYLRERFYDPASTAPPPPLEDVSGSAPEPPKIADIRTQGGPSFRDLREVLVMAAESGDAETVGELFNILPDSLRRPVEILGLLHLAASTGLTYGDSPAGEDTLVVGTGQAHSPEEQFDAIRPDGSTRQFLVARIPVPPPALLREHRRGCRVHRGPSRAAGLW